MKIEIAESLIYSYLKHVEGCRIVQTNWTTSGKWTVTKYEKERARVLFNKITSSEHFSGIFKKSSFDQLIKQAEIDVIGINTAEETIYGIDVAFHSAGLNYGSKTETAIRIVKKIFRTVFIMQSYFDENEKFKSYFITPKVNPATQVIIENLMIKAKEVINDDNISIDFISNEQFYVEIVDPLLINIDEEHDTAELFSRAIKLMNLDGRNRKSKITGPKPIINRITSSKKEVNGMKIGQFVQHSFRKAFDLNLLSDREIIELQKPEYSKRIFNSNFEVLRNKNRPIEDEYGRKRYYSKEIFCGNYHLTSQWIEPQWKLLLDWLKKIGYEYKNYAP
ncbi:hypothetical protein [Flavobacterium sp. ASW18X]|uniref:hypothetical protein n=1 Tax=Flavobacterium sp. ASW18X TaxID=2572595 RepID=UPI0010ADA86D|nr:hypothetical protein [Flavobacterium sp. ASW18X]TKD65166.1 hypothetical protein FBT53_06460 [Flavobacterium sp. ASW18X]